MAIRSRQQRERERRRKAKKNRTQLLGAAQQGQRRPMQQGYTTTSVKPPPFRESSASADIMQAGQAYKGAKGLHDFTMGKEAYTDAAGNVVPARAPFSFGDKSILGEGGHVDEYFGKVGDRFTNTGRDLGNLFGTSTPQPDFGPAARVPASGGGLFGSTTPTSPPASSYGHAVPGSQFASEAATKAAFLSDPEAQMMMKSGLIDAGAGGGGGMITQGGTIGQGGFLQSGIGQGMGDAVSASSVGSNIPYGSGSAFQGANAANTASTAAKASSGLQGADAASGASGASGQPWLAYANIAKDLFVGGPGSEKITGSTAGDAVIRAAAAYYTFGMSEIAYGLF